MRTLITKLVSGLAACLTLSGCMQHNGDIGDWFGTWKLEAITVDGTEAPSYEGNIFFQFQTDIVRIVEVDTSLPATRTECFGRWEENDGILTLDFSYSADGINHFTPMPETLLDKGINLLTIDSQTSKKMRLTGEKTDPAQTVVYTFRKS